MTLFNNGTNTNQQDINSASDLKAERVCTDLILVMVSIRQLELSFSVWLGHTNIYFYIETTK